MRLRGINPHRPSAQALKKRFCASFDKLGITATGKIDLAISIFCPATFKSPSDGLLLLGRMIRNRRRASRCKRSALVVVRQHDLASAPTVALAFRNRRLGSMAFAAATVDGTEFPCLAIDSDRTPTGCPVRTWIRGINIRGIDRGTSSPSCLLTSEGHIPMRTILGRSVNRKCNRK